MLASPLEHEQAARLSESIDRPEEDTVLLAPKLEFTSGKSGSSENHEDDIESPFARPAKNSIQESAATWISPVRGSRVDPGESVPLFALKGLTGGHEPAASGQPAHRASGALEIAASAPMPSSRRPSGTASLSETRTPSKTGPFADRSAWSGIGLEHPEEDPLQDPKMSRAVAIELEATSTRRLSSDVGRRAAASSSPVLAFPPSDDLMMPRCGATSIAIGKDGPPAAGASESSRWFGAIGKLRPGPWGLLATLGRGWSGYSATCDRLQTHISIAAGRMFAVGRRQGGKVGPALKALGLSVAHLARLSIAVLEKAASAAKPRMMAVAEGGRAAAGQALPRALSAKLWLIRAAAASIGRLQKTFQARGMTASVETSMPASITDDQPKAPALGAALARLASTASVFRRLTPVRTPRLAVAGISVASIVFLVAAFGPSPLGPSASASLTFPIPERPSAAWASLTFADPWWSDHENGDQAALAAGAVKPALSDPIAGMIAHVSQGRLRSATAIDANPVLSGLGAIEGLAAFTRAAEVVGLAALLRSGNSYTIFAPNDAAFAKLAPGEFDRLLEPAGHLRLLSLLSHHIVPERLTFDDLAGRVGEYISLAGQPLTIDATEVVRVGGAGMIEADLDAEGGIFHVIDGVLVLPAS